MQNPDLTSKTDRIMDRFTFIKAIMVADKEDGVEIFENKRLNEEEAINDLAGGISAVRYAMADMCNTILDQEVKSIVIKFDKLTVFKRILYSNIILIIICDTKGLDISVLYDLGDEIEENFKSLSKIIDEI
ncbi:unnamed protein product [Moneuplotes crassus]|uniref:Uncharacterized protein n=1 Tax=Euplotes crassus TaxID=5936 RepID=A0AAD1Y2L6_EUPCR|nr:unnamed protein product [Moneuplotes crassus]